MAPCTIPLDVPWVLSRHLSTSAASTLRRQSVGNLHVMSVELDALRILDTMTHLLILQTQAVMLSSWTSTTASGVKSTLRTRLACRSTYSSSRRRHLARRARVYHMEVLRTHVRRMWLPRLRKCGRYCACSTRFRQAHRL